MARIGARRDNGKLFFDFNWAGRRCREQTSLLDTPINRQRTERVLRNIVVDIERGSFVYADYFPDSPHAAVLPSRKTVLAESISAEPPEQPAITTPLFRDFAETWFGENEVRWRRTTRGTMRMILDDHLSPRFGDKPVTTISRADVLAFRAEFAKRPGKRAGQPVSPKTVNDVIGTLKCILDEAAVRHEFSSPCQRIKRLRVPRSDIQPFTLEEMHLLLDRVRADYRAYLTVRMLTGMRTGEANGLKWKHIDFQRREIHIRETFTHGAQDDTKTDESWREVAMSKPVFDALQAHSQQRGGQADDYVFCNRNGEPLDNKNFCARVWYPLLRHLGLSPRRPYQMRHTCATLWLVAGENPLWIARQLGHASVEMLFRVYARWVRNMASQDGQAFESLLAASAPAPANSECEGANIKEDENNEP